MNCEINVATARYRLNTYSFNKNIVGENEGKNVSQNVKKINILFASAIITLPNNLIIKVSKILYRAIDTKVMGGDDG